MNFRKTWRQVGLALLFAAGTAGMVGCDNHVELDVPPVYPSNSNMNVVFTSFAPTEGGARTNMLIYGDNFGSDPSLIDVKIGGQVAKVIRAKDNEIYCMVPANADQGYVEVTVWNGDRTSSVSHRFEQYFNYIHSTLVGTLCGVVDGDGNAQDIDGTFEEAGMIQPGMLYRDPKDPDVIFLFDQQASRFRRIDIEAQTVETLVARTSGWDQVNSIAWSVTGDTMFVNNNAGSNPDGSAMFILKREDDFKRPELVMRGADCNAVFINPFDGKLFAMIGTNAKIHAPQWDEASGMYQLGEWVASVATNGVWFQNMQFSPTGDYYMGVAREEDRLYRGAYNWDTHLPYTPSVFAGSGEGYGEGMGTQGSWFNGIRQGVYVYNEEYAEQGYPQKDCYDFYVCGGANHCIHKVTPQGAVSTYAGRGSVSTDGEVAGYIDGSLRTDARFSWPEGICYIEERKTFYISDAGNHRIRTITIE